MKKPAIIILGSIASVPTPQRFVQSILVLGLNDVVLIDCGEATQIRLQQAHIDVTKLSAVAITHIHGDHVLGLFPLLQSFMLRTRSQNVRKNVAIIAPQVLCRAIEPYISLFGEEGVEPLSVTCINARDFVNREFINVGSSSISIMPIEMIHGNAESYGYVLKIVRRRRGLETLHVFVSGDGICGSVCRTLLKSLGIDVVIHEATFMEFDKLRARSTGHATCIDAAELAWELGSKLLVLTHFSSRYSEKDLVVCLEQARAAFRGQIILARDLMYIPLTMA